MIILTTYWDEKNEKRIPRTMQIKKMTINCANCGTDFEMDTDRKDVDVLREIEIWIGDCPHCFVTNAFTFRVMAEDHRIPSDAVLVKRKAASEDKRSVTG